MSTKEVVVQGGGDNLYKVSEYSGTYYVYKVSIGIFSNTDHDIGKTRDFSDALSIIKAHSGREIKSIKDW